MSTATRLKNLKVRRVDLVDVGASYDAATGTGAAVLLCKRADEPTTCEECQEVVGKDAAFCSACGAKATGKKPASADAKDDKASKRAALPPPPVIEAIETQADVLRRIEEAAGEMGVAAFLAADSPEAKALRLAWSKATPVQPKDLVKAAPVMKAVAVLKREAEQEQERRGESANDVSRRIEEAAVKHFPNEQRANAVQKFLVLPRAEALKKAWADANASHRPPRIAALALTERVWSDAIAPVVKAFEEADLLPELAMAKAVTFVPDAGDWLTLMREAAKHDVPVEEIEKRGREFASRVAKLHVEAIQAQKAAGIEYEEAIGRVLALQGELGNVPPPVVDRAVADVLKAFEGDPLAYLAYRRSSYSH